MFHICNINDHGFGERWDVEAPGMAWIVALTATFDFFKIYKY